MAVTPPTPDPTPDPKARGGPDVAASSGATAGPSAAYASGAAAGASKAGGAQAAGYQAGATHTGAAHAGRFRADDGANGSSSHPSAKAVLTSMLERLGEIREYVSYYADTKTDAIKQQVTWAGIYAALGILGGLIGAAILVTATVLFVNGIAGALAALFGHREWLGQLVTGLLLLGLFAGGVVIGLKVLRGSFKKKLRAKYEQRHQDQRARYGADVPQRARERQEQQGVA